MVHSGAFLLAITTLLDAEQYDRLLAVTPSALRYFHDLATQDPTHLGPFISCLATHAMALACTGHGDDALAAADHAVEIVRSAPGIRHHHGLGPECGRHATLGTDLNTALSLNAECLTLADPLLHPGGVTGLKNLRAELLNAARSGLGLIPHAPGVRRTTRGQ